MQGNFEKLTREELVIVEGENVLQPAAIQKVMMVMGVTVAVVRMIVMMITVMMTMLMMIAMMMMMNAQMLTLHNAVSKSRPPEIPLDEVCARSFTPSSSWSSPSSPASAPSASSSPCWNLSSRT